MIESEAKAEKLRQISWRRAKTVAEKQRLERNFVKLRLRARRRLEQVIADNAVAHAKKYVEEKWGERLGEKEIMGSTGGYAS